MPFFLRIKKNLAILLALIFVQLTLISFQLPLGEDSNYLERAIFAVFSPLQHGVVGIFRGVGRLWNDYFALHDVRRELNGLKREISLLQHQNNMLRVLLQRFRREDEILALLQDLYKSILPVRVIAMDFSNPYESAVINGGTLDGIQKDMFVIDKNGYLVGRIIEPVTFKQSRVQLITDDDSGISVYSEKEEVVGVVTGDGKGNCLLKYIVNSDDRVTEGERVFTTGFDEIFPRSLEVGTIISVSPTTDLFKSILVRPSFDNRALDQIAVVRLKAADFF